MLERGRLEFSADLVGPSFVTERSGDGDDSGWLGKEAVNVTDLDGIPDHNAGEALRDLKVNPSHGCQTRKGREHLTDAH